MQVRIFSQILLLNPGQNQKKKKKNAACNQQQKVNLQSINKIALIHTMRKSKTSNPYTGFYNPSIYDLHKVKTFHRPFPHIYSHPILVSPALSYTTMNVHY